MNRKDAALGKLVGWGFIVIGSLVTIAGAIWLLNTVWFVSKAATAPGKVLELERRSGSDGGSMFHPVFSFADAGGILHTQRSSFGSSDYPFEVGETITVLYDPKTPRRAKINTFETMWLGPLAITGFGLLFGGFAAFWLTLWIKGTKAAAQLES